MRTTLIVVAVVAVVASPAQAQQWSEGRQWATLGLIGAGAGIALVRKCRTTGRLSVFEQQFSGRGATIYISASNLRAATSDGRCDLDFDLHGEVWSNYGGLIERTSESYVSLDRDDREIADQLGLKGSAKAEKYFPKETVLIGVGVAAVGALLTVFWPGDEPAVQLDLQPAGGVRVSKSFGF